MFEILDKNDKTRDKVDLTKYLLYKVVGRKSFGLIDEFDFSIYDPDNFQSLDGQYGGKSNIEGVPGQIYDFLLAKGVPPVGAAAILGNIEGESSFNPAATNGSHNGLCQWDIGGRFTGLQSLASSKGKEWTDVQTQLEYMWSELEGNYSNVKEVIMSATEFNDMEYATWYFGRYYEVFFTSTNYEASKGKTAQRYEYAKKWYTEWQNKHTSGSVGENGTIYYQQDYSHIPYGSSNIGDCGCGPTAFAMVASDYTGKKITPEDAVKWCGNQYYVWGAGTSWAYFNAATKHFNLPANCVDLGNNINAAADQLRQGNLVISSQSAGLFTNGGHFILLSSINQNGGIKVRDPNKNNALNKGYKDRIFTQEEISRSSKNYWAFVK